MGSKTRGNNFHEIKKKVFILCYIESECICPIFFKIADNSDINFSLYTELNGGILRTVFTDSSDKLPTYLCIGLFHL